MTEQLLAFLGAAAVLSWPTFVAAASLRKLAWCPPAAALIVAGGATAFAGYVSFWAWFGHTFAGNCWTAAVLVATNVQAWRTRTGLWEAWRDAEVRTPLLLMFVVGAGYVGVLHLYELPGTLDEVAENRFLKAMPPDNRIPRMFAERLRYGNSPRDLIGDWKSSDRPPLQTGVILLSWPVLKQVRTEFTVQAIGAGMWLQLLWIPAAWALFRRLSLTRAASTALLAVTAASGFHLFHSVYLWPKFGGAALTVGAFVLYAPPRPQGTVRVPVAAALAALGWLCHGGTAFSLIALAAMAVFWRPWPRVVPLAAGAVTAGLLMASWMAYQAFYEPPGNRLLKWHFAGVIPPDDRGTVEAIAAAYRDTPWETVVENRKYNLRLLVDGGHANWFDFGPATLEKRRRDQFLFFFHSFGLWNFAALLVPFAWLRSRDRGFALAAAVWTALGIAVWVLMMFGPPGVTVVHHGSFAINLTLFALAFAAAWRVSPWLFAALASFHVAAFLATWLPPHSDADTPLSYPAAAVAGAAGLALIAVAVHAAWRGEGGDGATG